METNGNKALTAISNILSAVFSPLLVPTYAFAMAMWITYLAYLPESVRFIQCAVIFCITTVIPLGAILLLIRLGKVSDAAISKPSERALPYTITIVCYIVAAVYIFTRSVTLLWLSMFFVGAAVAGLIDALITIKWKISAHTTSMGGLCALALAIGIFHLSVVNILPWVIVTLVLSGAVGSARLYLKRHTPGQVYAGWLVGAAVTFAAVALVIPIVYEILALYLM